MTQQQMMGHLRCYPAIFQTDNTSVAGALIELTFPSDVPAGTSPVFDALPSCPDPRVHVELLPQATLKVRPLAMKRLIGNLIDNARKHAGPDITLRTARESNDIVLSVLDRGPGIPPEEVDRLKQPFTRRDVSRSGHSGAGLGLAIVERIARIHGGRFELLPRAGGGTEARVTLPLS